MTVEELEAEVEELRAELRRLREVLVGHLPRLADKIDFEESI